MSTQPKTDTPYNYFLMEITARSLKNTQKMTWRFWAKFRLT